MNGVVKELVKRNEYFLLEVRMRREEGITSIGEMKGVVKKML